MKETIIQTLLLTLRTVKYQASICFNISQRKKLSSGLAMTFEYY